MSTQWTFEDARELSALRALQYALDIAGQDNTPEYCAAVDRARDLQARKDQHDREVFERILAHSRPERSSE